jgi:cobyrinic acid a,c-diamide synthase
VVLNRVGSERHHALLAEALASIEVPLLGVLPHHPSLELPSRHLGLLPPGELHDLEQRQNQWAELAVRHLNLERLIPLLAPPTLQAGAENPITWCLRQSPQRLRQSPQRLPVAIASDAAFHFRYPEASELLEAVGLEPLAWSPLADEPLPNGCRAVLLPGGYPELHASHGVAAAFAIDQGLTQQQQPSALRHHGQA